MSREYTVDEIYVSEDTTKSEILAPPIYVTETVSAVGGGFQPAWAMNSNLPVLGTGTY
jgi:hypothetical protein